MLLTADNGGHDNAANRRVAASNGGVKATMSAMRASARAVGAEEVSVEGESGVCVELSIWRDLSIVLPKSRLYLIDGDGTLMPSVELREISGIPMGVLTDT